MWVIHACILEVIAGYSDIQGHIQLYSEMEARLGYITPYLERDKKLMWIANAVLILNILPRIFKAQIRESLVILHIQKEIIFILSHFPSLVESSPLFHKSEVCLLHSKPFPILMKVLKFTF